MEKFANKKIKEYLKCYKKEFKISKKIKKKNDDNFSLSSIFKNSPKKKQKKLI